jgi:outer membrane protein TolC
MSMREEDMKHAFPAMVKMTLLAIVIVAFSPNTAAAQDSASPVHPSAPKIEAIPTGKFAGISLFSTAGSTERDRQSLSVAAGERARVSAAGDRAVRASRTRRLTLEEAKHSIDPAASPMAHLSQLSVDAARQHRLGVQADYFPKFGATFTNLHFTEFLGQVVTLRRLNSQVALPLLAQDQTVAALTFVQPITPLFVVHQAVKIARADERIAKAKAGVAVTKNTRDAEIEEIYLKLLIAKRQVTAAGLKLGRGEGRQLYAAASIESIGSPEQDLELVEARKAFDTASVKARELTAALNRAIGWPEDTELDLALPNPLVEHVSLEEIANKSVAANPDLVEAEQTVVKARAASRITKFEYVPTVAAVAGYMFQNAIPALSSNFGYGGVMASYTLFDFGKRERAVKEARARLGMAELALQMTRAKIAADLKKSYFELERSRELSNVAQKMGSSLALLMRVNSAPESGEAKAARVAIEMEMLEADLAHRQAFARLKALMGS